MNFFDKIGEKEKVYFRLAEKSQKILAALGYNGEKKISDLLGTISARKGLAQPN